VYILFRKTVQLCNCLKWSSKVFMPTVLCVLLVYVAAFAAKETQDVKRIPCGRIPPLMRQNRTSGRFVKQEQWERWRAERKLVLGPSTRALLRGPEVSPPGRTNFEIVYAKFCNLVHFGRKMVCSAVHNAFLNTSTMGTPFLRRFPAKWPLNETKLVPVGRSFETDVDPPVHRVIFGSAVSTSNRAGGQPWLMRPGLGVSTARRSSSS